MTNKDKSKLSDAIVLMNAASEALAGVAKSDTGDKILSIGRLLGGFRGRFLENLKEEFYTFRELGKIKDDYLDTEQCKTGIQEILDAIENDMLDENLFNGMKKIFLVAATEKFSDRFNYLPTEYMRICRKLVPGEVLLLLANYNIIKKSKWEYSGSVISVSEWVSLIAENSELKHGSLILFHEKGLIDKNLLQDRSHSDRSGVGLDRNTFRLTDLGFALCEYIEHYDSLIENDHKNENL